MHVTNMFGWLTTRADPLGLASPRAAATRRTLPTTPAALLRWLPRLGPVLYLHVPPACGMATALPASVLVSSWTMQPLLETCRMAVCSAVTADGPLEWCECVDQRNRIRAQIFLLPDTDYLAWDALVGRAAARESQPPAKAPPFRPDRARIVSFRRRELAGLSLVGPEPVSGLSALGDRIAGRIARAETVALS